MRRKRFMLFAPPTVYFCPACNKPMLKMNYMSYTVRSGYGPRSAPDLAKCPNCAAVFFLHNLWAKKEDAPDEETRYYRHIEYPTRADYAKAIRNGLAKNAEEELLLKKGDSA
jgi:uncharacterized protein with PIN domain